MTRATENEGALRMRFLGIAESIGPMCHHFFLPLGRFPLSGRAGARVYRTRRKEHALPIVRDEFRPAIPRRVARQHCPSPLHRHHQLKTIAAPKGIIYHRTVTSLLTVCLSPRDKRTRSSTMRRKVRLGSFRLSRSKWQLPLWSGQLRKVGLYKQTITATCSGMRLEPALRIRMPLRLALR